MIEAKLLDQALAGDGDAFEHLLHPYRGLILNLAYRMNGDREDAKEISQEAVFKIFKYLRTFKKDMSFKNWICRIVINTAHDFRKKRHKEDNIIMDKKREFDSSFAETPEKQVLKVEIHQMIRSCLVDLTPGEKSVFLLRDGEGFSIKETAVILRFSSASVRTHLSRARRKIRLQMERMYPHRGRGGIE